MDNKQILIKGTNNRYQIKKLTTNKEEKKRKCLQNINLTNYSHEFQLNIIQNILSSNHDNKIFIQEIKNKISGYKSQDVSKKNLSLDTFVTFDYVIKLLNDCNLCCHYCNRNIYILYEIVRENMQWTLDRIHNDKGHNIDNVVICCLECNLKRKRQNADEFFFTKNFKIIRDEYLT